MHSPNIVDSLYIMKKKSLQRELDRVLGPIDIWLFPDAGSLKNLINEIEYMGRPL